MQLGKLKRKLYTKEEILNLVDPYEIYKYYCGNFEYNKPFHSPMGDTDRDPSFVVHYKNGDVFHKHYSKTQYRGNAVDFVMQKFGLTLPQAVDKIAQDFGHLAGKSISTTPKKSLPTIGNGYVHMAFTDMPWTKKHHEYMNAYHLTEEHLKRKDVYAVKQLSIARRLVPLGDSIAFAYYAPDIDKCKILRIGVSKEDKWRNNTPFNYVWNLPKLQCAEKGMVCKSRKDEFIADLFGIQACSSNAENISCFTQENVDKINGLFREVYLAYGTDTQGKKESHLITKTFGWKHYNTPDIYLPDINDLAEFSKFDIKLLEEHLKSKKLI